MARKTDIEPDYYGFDIDDKFVVGYGLDYEGYMRNLPYIGYFVSLSVNYVLNSLIVFKNRLGIRRYLRFLLSYIPNFVIYTLVTLLTINVCDMDQFWATVLATMAGAPIKSI